MLGGRQDLGDRRLGTAGDEELERKKCRPDTGGESRQEPEESAHSSTNNRLKRDRYRPDLINLVATVFQQSDKARSGEEAAMGDIQDPPLGVGKAAQEQIEPYGEKSHIGR